MVAGHRCDSLRPSRRRPRKAGATSESIASVNEESLRRWLTWVRLKICERILTAPDQHAQHQFYTPVAPRRVQHLGYRKDERSIARHCLQHLAQDDFSPKPPARRSAPSKLDPCKPIIRQWLGDDARNWRKQRHAAREDCRQFRWSISNRLGRIRESEQRIASNTRSAPFPLCLIPKSSHGDPFPNGTILHKGH